MRQTGLLGLDQLAGKVFVHVLWGIGLTSDSSSEGMCEDGLGEVYVNGRRTNEMHRTQDSYVSVSCNCRRECSLEASARAWGVGDLECRSAAKPCRLPLMFCGV